MTILLNNLLVPLLHVAQAINIDPLPHATADPAKIKLALTVVFTVLGTVSVIMVVIGGIKYAGSQGDPAGTTKAKNTIMYAIIGVVIAIFATTIVQFTVYRLFG